MRMVLTIVRLRWLLTFSVLRRSIWQKIGFVLSILAMLALIVGSFVGAYFLGSAVSAEMGNDFSQYVVLGALQSIVLFMSLSVVGFMLIMQVFMFGDDNTLKSQNFAFYGIAARQLHSGIVASAMSGIGGIGVVVALAVWSFAYRCFGWLVVFAAVVCAPIMVLTVVSFAKMLVAVLNAVLVSRRARNVFYVIFFVLYVAFIMFANSFNTHSNNSGVHTGFTFGDNAAAFVDAMRMASWIPLVAAMQIPFDVAVGDWWFVLARCVLLAFTIVACFLIGSWCVAREVRLVRNQAKTVVKTKGIGLFAVVSDCAAGAIAARIMTYWRRDIRQLIILLFPFLIVVCALVSQVNAYGPGWEDYILSGWLVYAAIIMSMVESNGIAYDGSGFVMNATIGVRGLFDRLGRAVAWAVLIAVYLLALLALGFGILFVMGHGLPALPRIVFAACIVLAAGWVSLGVALVFSTVAMYPVQSIEKPFTRPQGRTASQTLMPLLFLLIVAVLLSPAVIVFLCLVLMGYAALVWVAGVVALVIAVAVLVLGVWLGGKLLDQRLLRIVENVQRFAKIVAC